MDNLTKAVFRIYVAVTMLYRVEDGIDKLVKRARKLGKVEAELIGFEIDWADTKVMTGTVVDFNVPGHFRSVRYDAVAVTVTGPAVRINGWDFVGVIQPAASGENVLHTLNGQDHEVPDSYRKPTAVCEHCGTTRRRKQTYLLRNVSKNAWVQVGSTCLSDFFDGSTPAHVAKMASYLTGFENYLRGLGEYDDDADPDAPRHSGPYGIAIDTYLAHVCADVRVSGWKSRGEYRSESTADAALETYHDHRAAQPTDADRSKAAAVLEWLRGEFAETATSEYERNLATLTANGAQCCWAKHAGLLASAVTCYDRAERKAERKAAEAKHGNTGSHVGEVGQRLTVKATVTRVSYTEGFYGTTSVVGLRTLDGNAMVWFASGVKEYTEGAVYEVTGTVKTHGEFAGQPQTVVNRCRFTEVTA